MWKTKDRKNKRMELGVRLMDEGLVIFIGYTSISIAAIIIAFVIYMVILDYLIGKCSKRVSRAESERDASWLAISDLIYEIETYKNCDNLTERYIEIKRRDQREPGGIRSNEILYPTS